MTLSLPPNPGVGDSGHINAHVNLHLNANGMIYSATAYWTPATSVSDATAGHLMQAAARGAVSGVASLDGNSLLPAAQLPLVAMRRDQPNLQTPITGIIIENYNTAAPFGLLTIRGGRGTQALPVANANNDILSAIFLNGQAGTTYGTDTRTGAGMRARATQAWSSGNNGAQLEIFTYPNTSSGGVVTALTIGQDQSAAFAANVAVTGDTTMTGALTVTGTTTLNGTVVAATLLVLDGSVTNTVTAGSGLVAITGTAGALFQVVRDSGALLGSGQPIVTLQGRAATDSAHTIGSAGRVEVMSDAAFSAGSSPGRIQFRTTPSASTTEVVRALIDNAGKIWVGLTAAAAVASIDQTGKILCLGPTGGIGYGTGAGGTVTQATSKATGVTLNTPVGQITMNNAALLSATVVSFVVTNSTVGANDMVLIGISSGGTLSAYTPWVSAVAAGSFTIAIRNTTAGSLSEAPVITFQVIKGAIA